MKLKDISENKIKEAIQFNKSKRSTLKYLLLPEKNPQTNADLEQFIKINKIDISHFISYKDLSKIDEVIAECYSVMDVIRAVGYSPNTKSINSRTFNKVKRYIESKQLDTSHFNYMGRRRNSGQRYSEENVFSEKAQISGQTLKNRYLKKRETYQCDAAGCGLKEWLAQPIVLQLDHINGISDDNRIENLRLLCPNCHSQTTTFAGRKCKK